MLKSELSTGLLFDGGLAARVDEEGLDKSPVPAPEARTASPADWSVVAALSSSADTSGVSSFLLL